MKTYYTTNQRRVGRFTIIENNDGHYREIGSYSSRDAAIKATEILNSQQIDPSPGAWLIRQAGAL